ncbi:MAG: hypothetical protein HZA35_01400 [Parcubacteria group bacterium]|nr:hypothetical protein [Parcubacteria group bacterium]
MKQPSQNDSVKPEDTHAKRNNCPFSISPIGDNTKVSTIISVELGIKDTPKNINVGLALIIPIPFSTEAACSEGSINMFCTSITSLFSRPPQEILNHAKYRFDSDTVMIGFPIFLQLGDKKMDTDFYVTLPAFFSSPSAVDTNKDEYGSFAILAIKALVDKLNLH